MLNKAICKQCIETHEVEWYELWENQGLVWCIHNIPYPTRKITAPPPEHCPYNLEHQVMEYEKN
jgi:hypothetical protein